MGENDYEAIGRYNMQFNLDMGEGQNQIRAYEPGKITINDKVYQTSVIVTPAQIIPDWEIRHCNQLTEQHINTLLELKPDVILLGTGEDLIFPNTDILMPLTQNAVGIEVMTTAAACRTYNVLMAEGRNVVAAMIIR
jgi:uncharacterized protein